MNTDAILDFIVEHYIWFIAGGAVLLLALIGFVARRSKALSKKDKINNDDKETEVLENIDLEKDNQNMQVNNYSNLNNNNQLNDASQMQTNNIENMEPVAFENNVVSSNDNNEQEMDYMQIFNYDAQADSDDQEEIITHYVPVEQLPEETDGNEELEYYTPELDNQDNENVVNPELLTNLDAPKTLEVETQSATGESIEVPTVMDDSAENSINNTEPVINNYKSNNLDTFAFSTVDDDIDRLSKLQFGDDETTDDKLENTMQISYSQLKDIVKDIISEEDDKKSDNVEQESLDTDLANEKSEVSSSINENETTESKSSNDLIQPDNEDDVWKF